MVLGYEVSIEDCSLGIKTTDKEKVFRKLKYGDLGLSDFWKQEGDRIVPVEGWFKWGDWFEEDLKKMVKMGAAGAIVLKGEDGEYFKYELNNNGREKIMIFFGQIVFPKKPDKILEV